MRDEAGFFIAVALLFIVFAGDPDLHDAIVTHLMGDCPMEKLENE